MRRLRRLRRPDGEWATQWPLVAAMGAGLVMTQHTSVWAHSWPPPPRADWLHLESLMP